MHDNCRLIFNKLNLCITGFSNNSDDVYNYDADDESDSDNNIIR